MHTNSLSLKWWCTNVRQKMHRNFKTQCFMFIFLVAWVLMVGLPGSSQKKQKMWSWVTIKELKLWNQELLLWLFVFLWKYLGLRCSKIIPQIRLLKCELQAHFVQLKELKAIFSYFFLFMILPFYYRKVLKYKYGSIFPVFINSFKNYQRGKSCSPT